MIGKMNKKIWIVPVALTFTVTEALAQYGKHLKYKVGKI